MVDFVQDKPSDLYLTTTPEDLTLTLYPTNNSSNNSTDNT